jgi:Peptidase family C78
LLSAPAEYRRFPASRPKSRLTTERSVELVDFELKNEPKGVQVVTDWVIQYFSPSPTQQNLNDALRGVSAVTVTDRMPLILQHEGHSRTIVGYEVGRTGAVNLIVFDPSR